jgi:mannose-6-phosphate isomerase-like protein (cupin superfamily)
MSPMTGRSDAAAASVQRLTELMRIVHNDHGGVGSLRAYRAFDRTRHTSGIAFIDLVVLPSGSSIGLHQHGDDQETYVILSGSGVMTLDGSEHRVGPGDLIRNAPYGRHGLVNDGTEDLHLLVFEIAPAERDA